MPIYNKSKSFDEYSSFKYYKIVKSSISKNYKGFALDKLFASRLALFIQNGEIPVYPIKRAFRKSKQIPIFFDALINLKRFNLTPLSVAISSLSIIFA